ncbi:hypothetical protein RSAG8_04820, partial [Rhizoctonia solani AG-8 WAC10335]
MVTRGGPGSANSQRLDEIWEEDNKIVVGIDIGTTQSGVALTYLEKGERQEIHRIAKWPGQGEQDQRSKVPTVIWYNLETKKVRRLLAHMNTVPANRAFYQAELFGAEAMSRNGREVDGFATAGIEDFENFAKRNFGNPDEPPTGPETVSIRVASTGSYGTALTKIHRGCMKIPNSVIKECFDASARPILSSVAEQLKNQTVQHVLLVGGFGDSPYLHQKFSSRFGSNGREVVFANDSTAKAVADGSVIWNTLCSVVSRTPRHSFGIVCAIPYFPWSVVSRTPRHSFGIVCAIPYFPWSKIPGAKKREAYIGPEGVPMIPGKWFQIVKKGVPVDAEKTYKENYRHATMEPDPTSISLSMELFSYSGDDEPTWAWDKRSKSLINRCDYLIGIILTASVLSDILGPKFKEVCTITAELYDAGAALKKETGFTGIDYWYLDVDVCICFGTTELQAHLEWEQNGVMREGPATVVAGRPVDL